MMTLIGLVLTDFFVTPDLTAFRPFMNLNAAIF